MIIEVAKRDSSTKLAKEHLAQLSRSNSEAAKTKDQFKFFIVEFNQVKFTQCSPEK